MSLPRQFQSARSLSEAERPAHSTTILLVEDNEPDAVLVQEYLSEIPGHHFETHHVTNVAAAHEALHRGGFDALLVDLDLPDARGLDAVTKLVGFDIPVVVLTGSNDTDFGLRCIATGAQDFLPKNAMHAEALHRVVRFAVSRSAEGRRTQHLAELIRNASDALLIVDRDAAICFANQAARRLLGNSVVDGNRFPYPYADRERDLDICAEGEDRVVEMRSTPVQWEGRQARLLTLLDVTERRRSEQLERRLLHADRLTSMGKIAASVAHEVNNPAAAVLANSRWLREELTKLNLPDSALGPVTEIIDDNIEAMQRIVNIVRELHGFSRMGGGQIDRVSLNDVVASALRMTGKQLGVDARVEQDLAVVPAINADLGQLVQVVTNLLLNAIHAVGGQLTQLIVVSTRYEEPELVLRVRDTGCGIPQEDLERIFAPFVTTKDRGAGAGLGLPLCQDIVRRHGGRIEVRSQVGVGSVFEVRVPERTGLELTQKPERPKRGPTQARILLIDDEPFLLRAMKRLLRHHDVVTANGGQDALRVLERDSSFDVVVCDVVMPEVDGIAVYEKARTLYPQLADRFVFCTGGAFSQRAQRFVSYVDNPVLIKPVDRVVLEGAIQTCLTGNAPLFDEG